MSTAGSLLSRFYETLREKYGERIRELRLPPPVFDLMKGELLDLDLQAGTLKARFPILEDYLNPYGAMQGGMIAAAVDNTVGPLSVAIAPPSVTRSLEMKYSQPVRPEMEYIHVQATLVERTDTELVFDAEVSSPDGAKLARCRAVHRILQSKAA